MPSKLTTSIIAVLSLFLLRFIIVHVSSLDAPKDRSDVIFSIILHRHGARTNFVSLLNENDDVPLGELIVDGQKQMFELGTWLRSRYSHLLPETHDRKDILVRSSDSDRTIVSALCLLSGLYPLNDDQAWNSLNPHWQPIPVHSITASCDNLLAFTKPCPLHKKILDGFQVEPKHPDYIRIEQLRAIYYSKVPARTAPRPVGDELKELRRILNETTTELQGLNFTFNVKTTQLQRLYVGVLLNEIVTGLTKRTEDESVVPRKMLMFSAHDLTLISVMETLKINDGGHPPFASCLMFDLYRLDEAEEWAVAIYYRNSSTAEPVLLRLPECEELCELSRFVDILAPVTLDNQAWEEECRDV